jgi:hypothetical protein
MVMRPVTREEIVDYQTYEDEREAFRKRVLEAKEPRRIHVGDVVTLLFENRLTVRYQVQEMMRVERIVRDADIRHEIDTYNELLGGPGELGATMLIEIDDEQERDRLLTAWHGMPERVYVELEDGRRAFGVPDARQSDERRISSVHYLRFAVGDVPPIAVGIDFPGLTVRAALTPAQRAALEADLRDDA